jgi:hypothetical protein
MNESAGDQLTGQQNPLQPMVPKILLQGIAIAALGAVVAYVGWWLGSPDIGWIAAIIIWTAGYPAVEIAREIRTRMHLTRRPNRRSIDHRT